jgi:hypothetical protein
MRQRHIDCRKEIGAGAKSSISSCAGQAKHRKSAKNQAFGDA